MTLDAAQLDKKAHAQPRGSKKVLTRNGKIPTRRWMAIADSGIQVEGWATRTCRA